MLILNKYFTIYVPTESATKDINDCDVKRVLDKVIDVMSVQFGGVTAHKAMGTYDGKSEVVYLAKSFCVKEQEKEGLKVVVGLLKYIKEELSQDVVAFENNGEMTIL